MRPQAVAQIIMCVKTTQDSHVKLTNVCVQQITSGTRLKGAVVNDFK
jgi:hypothetical protein